MVGRPELLPGFVDRQIQGHVNQLLAMRMMLGRIARDGIMDGDRVLLAPTQIDPSVRAYRGDSQGGMMGAVYMSISTDVTRGLLGQPIAAYSWVWQRSVDADAFTHFLKIALSPAPLTNMPMTEGCNPHDRVRELTPRFDQQDRFSRTGRIEWFCDGICNCDDEGDGEGIKSPLSMPLPTPGFR